MLKRSTKYVVSPDMLMPKTSSIVSTSDEKYKLAWFTRSTWISLRPLTMGR